MTKAGLVGTVRGQIPVPGYAIKAGEHGLMLIDEAEKLTFSAREVLLSLLEDQYYTRPLGMFIQQEVTIPGRFYNFTAATTDFGTELHIESQFSAIIATMSFNIQGVFNKALVSRCFPLIVTTDLEDVKDVVFSRPLEPRVKRPKNIANVSFSDYHKIGPNIFDRSASGLRVKTTTAGFMTRVMGNFARLSCAQAVANNRTEVQYPEDTFIPAKMARINAFMYLASEIPLMGLNILGILWNMLPEETITVDQLARRIKRDTSTTVKHLRQLEGTNLIIYDKTRETCENAVHDWAASSDDASFGYD
jgi:hypothetical protein